MRKPSARTTLQVEAVESRQLLSGLTPVLTSRTYETVAADVATVVARLAKTHNTAQAENSLTRLSTRIPFGRTELASAWISDLASFNSAVPGSGRATVRLLLADLNRDVAAGVATGAIRVTGKHAAAFPGPGVVAPQSSLDSVRVANNTSLTLTVTVNLNNTGQSIVKTIPKNTAPVLFDFGAATGNFMTINIRNANGTSPPPYTTGLNRPISGYRGALFSVSVFAGYFSVGS
ncbi:hypothetical protein SAMN05444166_4050 [Singulisphaera sp. GP187]|uniref:hypothetical protein n=1 Tax=Singulisphaera sp. GP187 TaxID=1882752 RepID=UPI00092A6E1D|nr:hypothetical protein [Singulisphaera sp. GP187]SIO35613.1 hypothetical protein SAMN05444166_4050 [Singulisphaera sp. GP187]